MEEGPGGALKLHGHVDVVEHLGDVSYLYITLPDGANVIVSSPGTSRATGGQEISISAPDAAVHIFASDGTALQRPSSSHR
jgi:ABC-type sugar transport system ATPase subunit